MEYLAKVFNGFSSYFHSDMYQFPVKSRLSGSLDYYELQLNDNCSPVESNKMLMKI